MTSERIGRVCVFCGHPEVTNEHAYPDWLRNVLASIHESAGQPA